LWIEAIVAKSRIEKRSTEAGLESEARDEPALEARVEPKAGRDPIVEAGSEPMVEARLGAAVRTAS
jgi:hypothetical protein